MDRGFDGLFQEDVEEGDEEGEGPGEEKDTSAAVDGYVWFSLLDAVAEVTRLNWEQIYKIPAMDFLSYLVYAKAKNRRKAQEIKKYNK